MMIQFKNIFILVCAVFMFSSCAKEPIDQGEHSDDVLSIHLSLPDGPTVSATRALTVEQQESVINTITILFYSAIDNTLVKILTQADRGVSLSTTDIKFSSQLLDCTKLYNVVVLANLPASVIGLPALGSSFTELDKAYSTLTDRLSITDAGLIMSGLISNQRFNITPITTVNLVRQAVKFRVKLKFSKEFLDAYSSRVEINTAERAQEMSLRANNMPNASFIYGIPNATRFNTLATTYNMQMKDYTYTGFRLVDGVFTMEAYGYENVVSGQTLANRKAATNFILCLPYIVKHDDGTTIKVIDNYYKINIDDPTKGDARYATQRNKFYDISVTVHGFGGAIPQLDGLDVVTQVLPWNAVSTPVVTPNNNLLELSNTECQIYGEKDNDLLVATVMLKRQLQGPMLTIAKQGVGFDLVGPTSYSPEPYKLYEIRVKVTDVFNNGTITLTCGGHTQAINISANFDNQQLIFDECVKAISDVSWCTLSKQAEYVHSEQKWTQLYAMAASVYLNISKATLRDTKRTGTVMLTKADKTVTRVVMVQKPYLKKEGDIIEWATGNITIGHSPDGQLCYVIGGAFDYGLWFRF
ncbi:MAG: fimbrial protein, partial [Mucinivorans sp.]